LISHFPDARLYPSHAHHVPSMCTLSPSLHFSISLTQAYSTAIYISFRVSEICAKMCPCLSFSNGMEPYLLMCYTKAGLNCAVHAQVDLVFSFPFSTKRKILNKKDLILDRVCIVILIRLASISPFVIQIYEQILR